MQEQFEADIRALPHEKVSDLPGGAWRIKEMAEGVMCTIVNGEVTYRNGAPTGALPGRLIRANLIPQLAAAE